MWLQPTAKQLTIVWCYFSRNLMKSRWKEWRVCDMWLNVWAMCCQADSVNRCQGSECDLGRKWRRTLSANWPIKLSIDQQSMDWPSNHQSINQWTLLSYTILNINQSIGRLSNQSIQFLNKSFNLYVNHERFHEALKDQSLDQSFNQLINQLSVNQSINQHLLNSVD